MNEKYLGFSKLTKDVAKTHGSNMTVVCVKERKNLTLGRKYDVVDGRSTNNNGSYWVTLDDHNTNTVSKRYFKEIHEVRNDKLTDLGI